MTSATQPPVEIYQIKITLTGSHPSIWRRIEVPGNITLATLHRVLQAVMGWSNAHLHRFIAKGRTYAIPDPDDQGPSKPEDERDFTLGDLALDEGSRLNYEYDFGDNWQHELLVERIHPAKEGSRYPVCLAGAGACPPEDVGGVSGYAHFLDALADPKHREHQDFRDWIGGDFDPKQFDLSRVNQRLRNLA